MHHAIAVAEGTLWSLTREVQCQQITGLGLSAACPGPCLGQLKASQSCPVSAAAASPTNDLGRSGRYRRGQPCPEAAGLGAQAPSRSRATSTAWPALRRGAAPASGNWSQPGPRGPLQRHLSRLSPCTAWHCTSPRPRATWRLPVPWSCLGLPSAAPAYLPTGAAVSGTRSRAIPHHGRPAGKGPLALDSLHPLMMG